MGRAKCQGILLMKFVAFQKMVALIDVQQDGRSSTHALTTLTATGSLTAAETRPCNSLPLAVADLKGGGSGGGRPLWLIFFSKSRFFPCKRHIFRCAHLR